MAFFTGGTTYQPGGQVTATNLNALITAAIPQNLNETHFATDSKIVTVAGGKMASPTTGDLCWDTSAGGLFVYDGSNWIGIAPQSLQALTAQSSISSGDVVILDSANASSVKTGTNAAGLDVVVGIARSSATTGQTVLVQVAEIGLVNCTSAAVAIGDHLAKSTTAGKAVATTTGESFAVALSSKSGAAEDTVNCLLVRRTPGYVTSTFSTYTMTAASLTQNTWYDVPSAAVGASVTTDGTSRMKLTIYTSRVNQPVTLTISGLRMVSNAAANEIVGLRVVLNASTVLLSATTKGQDANYEAAPTPIATGNLEFIGLGTAIYQRSASYVVDTAAVSVTAIVPTAGTHTIGLQFQPGVTASYTASNETTATLSAIVH